jgi:D-galacturonate reductase
MTTPLAQSTVSVVCVGTGEYTTGYGLNSAKTDKGKGVVVLTMLDLKRRGLVSDICIAGVSGSKLPSIREHMRNGIENSYPGSKFDTSAIKTYPNDTVNDPLAYKEALDAAPKGSVVTVFTPDDTHFSICMDAIQKGHHVLVTKPAVMTLQDHLSLIAAGKKHNVLVAVEMHKRFDPIYSDARDRLRNLGPLGYFTSYMSQPKHQLQTFKAWAGTSSDISYYLNSHHVDFCQWVFDKKARPIRVIALAATGVAEKELGRKCEDTISLHVTWQNLPSNSIGISSFTSSWSAPPSDVHSQQHFHAQCHAGEVRVDQAHRGYTISTDANGFASSNPLFFRYTPDADGCFSGQQAYGYRSFELFVRAALDINNGSATPGDFDGKLATIGTTVITSAILEAGRKSLDAGGIAVEIIYSKEDEFQPIELK